MSSGVPIVSITRECKQRRNEAALKQVRRSSNQWRNVAGGNQAMHALARNMLAECMRRSRMSVDQSLSQSRNRAARPLQRLISGMKQIMTKCEMKARETHQETLIFTNRAVVLEKPKSRGKSHQAHRYYGILSIIIYWAWLASQNSAERQREIIA